MNPSLVVTALLALAQTDGASTPEAEPAAQASSPTPDGEAAPDNEDSEAPADGETTETSTTANLTPEFIKGELAHAGVIRVVPLKSFIGLRVGALFQDERVYLSLAPKADLRFLDGDLRLGLEVPLNFELYSLQAAADSGTGSGGFDNVFTLRERDYDTARDYVKFLRYLTYGKKEDNLFVNVGQLYASTLGHGQIMRRFAGNVDINQTRVGVQVDAYNDYGGFEAFLSDVTRGNLMGALVFIKPLSLFTENPTARSFSIGASWSTDLQAPLRLDRRMPVGTSPVGSVRASEDGIPLLAETEAIHIIGVDAELKVLKTQSSDLKTYADFSMINGAGSGITVGLLGRFNVPVGDGVHLLRTRLELRTYEANFVPSYFDTLYEFQKFQFTPDLEDPNLLMGNYRTKLDFIRNRTGPRRFGFYAEASYAIPEWLVLAAAFETESEGQDQHLMLHAEIPWTWLNIFVTYHQRNLSRPFTFDQNDLLYAGARLKIFNFLFVNGRVQKAFAWDTSAYDDIGAYTDNLNFQVDVELGWQF